MKIKLEIDIEFESWFEADREPKSKEEWADFLTNFLLPEGSTLGSDDGVHHDMIVVSSYCLKCADIVH